MSQTVVAKRAAFIRRYPRRQAKKEGFFFRAGNPEPRITFIQESRDPSISERREGR
jgi:hypothetical protein